jgi:uncharacterized RDD family membrane protein YckC
MYVTTVLPSKYFKFLYVEARGSRHECKTLHIMCNKFPKQPGFEQCPYLGRTRPCFTGQRVQRSIPIRMEMVLNQVCSNCGNARLPDGRFCLFCGDLLSEPNSKGIVPSQPTKPLAPSAPTGLALADYAGFWLRAWAGAIDVALEVSGALVLTYAIDLVLRRFGRLLGISPNVLKVATGMAFILILAVGSWLYCAFTESSSWRATVGKRILGLQVVTAEGDRIGFGQATVRHFMKFLSLFFLTIGFMMAGWTERRQALHDIPSDCLVIRVPRERSFSLLHG